MKTILKSAVAAVALLGFAAVTPALSAGVGACLITKITLKQVVDILKKSTRKFDGLKVQKPGGGTVDFSELSNTGGLINAYEAIKMAVELKGIPIEK